MIIYIAGNEEGIPVYRASFVESERVANLWSYYKFKLRTVKGEIMKLGLTVDLFLDSGAFSAKTQGVKIDIEEYIEFIKEHKDFLGVYAVLDDIDSPRNTYRNQKIMEEAGLNPLPCFHFGENVKWLIKYLDEGYDYIALGGMVPISTDALETWLRQIFSKYLCGKDGMPKVKVHGFGLTVLKLMKNFPWYSVDSTSWINTGRMGAILIPIKQAGSYNYLADPIKCSVSNRSPDIAKDGLHYYTLKEGTHRKAQVDEYLETINMPIGRSMIRSRPKDYKLLKNERWLTPQKVRKKSGCGQVERVIERGLSNDYRLRDQANILYYLGLQKALPEWPWPYKRPPGNLGGFFPSGGFCNDK